MALCGSGRCWWNEEPNGSPGSTGSGSEGGAADAPTGVGSGLSGCSESGTGCATGTGCASGIACPSGIGC